VQHPVQFRGFPMDGGFICLTDSRQCGPVLTRSAAYGWARARLQQSADINPRSQIVSPRCIEFGVSGSSLPLSHPPIRGHGSAPNPVRPSRRRVGLCRPRPEVETRPIIVVRRDVDLKRPRPSSQSRTSRALDTALSHKIPCQAKEEDQRGQCYCRYTT
jgi:hypothetical protein